MLRRLEELLGYELVAVDGIVGRFRVWREEHVDEGTDLVRRGRRRLVEDEAEGRGEEQDERNTGEQEAEGHPARQEEDVVLGAVVPDAPGVIGKNRYET